MKREYNVAPLAACLQRHTNRRSKLNLLKRKREALRMTDQKYCHRSLGAPMTQCRGTIQRDFILSRKTVLIGSKEQEEQLLKICHKQETVLSLCLFNS